MPVTTLNLDPTTPYASQLETPNTGPIVLLNNLVVPEGKMDEALATWEKTAEALRNVPGYISAQLHRGIGGANIMVNYAIWESAAALRDGLRHPDFLAALEGFPEGTTIRPVVLHKVAIPNVCVGH